MKNSNIALITGAIAVTTVTTAVAGNETAEASSALSATNLTFLVTFILALSIASERLVEIIKGWIPSLELKNADPIKESRRRSILQALAVASGILTAILAREYIPGSIVQPKSIWAVIGLGLLASGGSGFWNSILTYILKLKDLTKLEIEQKKQTPVTMAGYQDVNLGEEQMTSNECYDIKEN
jgi:hypothetical protein